MSKIVQSPSVPPARPAPQSKEAAKTTAAATRIAGGRK